MAEVARPTNSVTNQSEVSRGSTATFRRPRGWTLLGALFFVSVMLCGAFAGAVVPAVTSSSASSAASQHSAPSAVSTSPTTHTSSSANSFSGRSSSVVPTHSVTTLPAPTVHVSSAPAKTSAPSATVSVASSAPTHAAHAMSLSPHAALSATLSAPSAVDVNTPVTFTTVASGGTPPYSYSYSGLPPGCASANAATLPCTPTTTVGSPFDVTVTVTDSVPNTFSTSFDLTVNPAPSVGITVNPAGGIIDLGQGAVFTAGISGGTAPFTYTYTGLPAGCATTNAATLACVPTSTTGSPFTVLVTIHDASGDSASNTATLVVNPALHATFVASPSSLAVGQWTTYTLTVSGGTTPYSYSLSGSFPCWNSISGGGPIVGSTVTFTCGVDSNGPSTGAATVYDQASAEVYQTATIFANPQLYVSTNLGFSDPVNNIMTIMSTPVNGGVGPYTYGYSGLPAGCVSHNAPSITCTPTVVGQFYVNQTINDSSNPVQHAWTVNTLTVGLNVTATASTAMTDAGTQITFTSNVVGATGTITYNWVFNSGVGGTNCNGGSNPGDVSSFICSSSSVGIIRLQLGVSDSGTGAIGSLLNQVQVVVNQPPAISLPGSVSADLTQTVMLNPNYFQGGTAPFTYSWSNLPTGCTGANSLVLNCTATAAGSYASVTLTVTDSSLPFAQSVSATMVVIINPDPVATTPAASTLVIDASQSVTFTTNAFGGTGSYETFQWRNLPAGAACVNTYSASLTCTLLPGSYTLNVEATVEDTNYVWSAWSSPLTGTLVVSANPLLATPTASRGTLDIGQTVSLSVVVTNAGSGADSFVWSGLPGGCASVDAATIASCVPTATGAYVISVTVTDSNGVSFTSATTSLSVSIDPVAGGYFYAETPSYNPSADVGQVFTIWIYTANAGQAPYTFLWTGAPAGCTGTSNYYLTCTINTAGTISPTMTFSLTDGNGLTATFTSVFTMSIYPDPAISVPTITVNGQSFTQLDDDVEYTESTVLLNPGAGVNPSDFGWNWYNCGASSCTAPYWFWSDGSYQLTAYVEDNNGFVASATLSFVVVGDLYTNTPTVTNSNPDVGQTITLTGSFAGGTGPYAIFWDPNEMPTGCAAIVTTLTVTCTPSTSGTWYPQFEVVDAQGETSYSNDVQVTVNPDPVAYQADEWNYTNDGQAVTSLDVGEALEFEAEPDLGTETYVSYAWSGLPTAAVCTSITTYEPTCTFGAVASGIVVSVSYTVTDSNGVVSAPSPAITSTLDIYAQPVASLPTMIVNGVPSLYADEYQTVTVQATVVNPGSGDDYFDWSGLPDGCTYADSAVISCYLTDYDVYYTQVYIADSNGMGYWSSEVIMHVADNGFFNDNPSLDDGESDVGQGDYFYTDVYFNGEYALNAPTLVWSGLPAAGCSAPTFQVNYYPTNFWGDVYSQVDCVWNVPGTYTYSPTVTATDDAGVVMTGWELDTEVVSALPTTSAPIASVPSADVGQSGTFTANVLNPGAGYDTFYWSGLPGDCSYTSAIITVSCPYFDEVGTFSITVSIWDDNEGWTTSAPLSFTVYADPTAAYDAVNGQGGEPDYNNETYGSNDYVTASLGQSIYVYAHVTNVGSGGDSWYWTGVPGFCTAVTTMIWKCTPTQVGYIDDQLNFWLQDSNGYLWQGVGNLNAYISPDPVVGGLAASSTNVDVGQSVTFTADASDTYYGYDGDVWTNVFHWDKYNWTGLPTSVATCTNGLDRNPETCTFTAAGTYTLPMTVSAQDWNSRTSNVFTTTIVITVYAAPSISQPTVTIQQPDVGQTVTFTASVTSAGSGSDVYTWSDLPAGCPATATTLTVTCVLSEANGWDVSVSVEDSNHVTVWSSSSLYVQVYSDVVIESVYPSTSTVDVGQSFYLYTDAYDGWGTYNYTWSSLPAWCTGEWNARPTCTAISTGVVPLTATLTITDGSGWSVSGTFTSAITVSQDPMVSFPTASVPSVDYGQTVVFSTTLLNPGSGNWGVSWANLPCSTVGTGLTTGPCTAGAGTYDIYAKITDSNGFAYVAGPLIYHVFSDPSTNTPSLTAGGPDVGETSIITESANSGSLSYTYAWSVTGIAGGLSAIGCSPSVVATVNCVWTTPGTYFVTVVVTDSNGVASPSSQPLTIVVYPDPAVNHLVANPTTLDASETLTINATATGGTGSYSQYHWYGIPVNYCSQTTYSTGDLLQCTGLVAGTYTVSVVVIDSAGVVSASSPTITVIVNPALTVATPTASPTVADVGQTDTITAVPGGGTGTYTWAWSGLPATGCTGLTSQVVTCVLSQPGTFRPYVTVTDQADLTVISGQASLTVELPLTTAITSNTSVDAVGSPQWFEDNIHGGDAPYTVTWAFGDGAGASQAGTYLNWSVQHVYRMPGTYTVTIWVNDSAGFTATATYQVTMAPAFGVVVSLSANDVSSGSTITATATATGGSGGYTFTWWVGGVNMGTGSTLTFKAGAAGENTTVMVTATDSAGVSVSGSTVLTTVPSTSASTAAQTQAILFGYSAAALTIGLLVVFALLLLYLFTRRRRENKQGQGSAAAATTGSTTAAKSGTKRMSDYSEDNMVASSTDTGPSSDDKSTETSTKSS